MVVTSHIKKYQKNPDLTNSSDSFTNLEFQIYEKKLGIIVMISFLTGKLSKKPVLDQ